MATYMTSQNFFLKKEKFTVKQRCITTDKKDSFEFLQC